MIKDELFGLDEVVQPFNLVIIREQLEKNVNDHIQKVEIGIFQSCQYNLNIGTGVETLHMIMDQACGNEYDFSNLIKVFNKIAIQNIFYDPNRLNVEKQDFKIGEIRQTTQVLASVKMFCNYAGWQTFYNDLISYCKENNFEIDISAIEILVQQQTSIDS